MKLETAKSAIPGLPIAGGCQCGKIRYRILARPVIFYLCHCTECQRHTSSAFGESLAVDRAGLEVSGSPSLTTRLAESGNRREGYFCPDCGVRIFHGSRGSRRVTVKAGTLDDTGWLVPAGHIWTRSRQPFIRFGENELCYEREPDDGYAALADRWRRMTSP